MHARDYKNSVFALLYLFILLLVLPVKSFSGQSYYVSLQGSDNNNGSKNTPWFSLRFAVKSVAAGDTIFIRGGTYTMGEVFIDRGQHSGGSPGNYLTIKAYPGEQPILQPGTRRLIIHADYVRVEGLHFVIPWRCEAFGAGLQIVNNVFTGPQAKFGAITTGGTDLLIEGNYINYDGGGGGTQDHGIYIHNGERITVRNNTVIGSQGYGIQVFEEHKSANPEVWAASPIIMRDYILEGNFVADSKQRSGMLIAKGRGGTYITLENITVRNNIFVRNAGFGLKIREGINISVFNNTFYRNNAVAMFVSAPSSVGVTPAQDVTMKNNIFDTETEIAHVEILSPGGGMLLENNLYDSDPRIFGVSDSKTIVGQPQFVDAGAENFHLQESSPAIDAGMDVGLPFVGSAPDVGAFEFNGTPSGVENTGTLPENFVLHQNYPNPFNPETKIDYDILHTATVRIIIYNQIGRIVQTLVQEKKKAGSYSTIWNSRNKRGEKVASGIYFYTLEIISQSSSKILSQTKKMILLR